MNNARYTVVGLGELLWDLLPSGARLGGAPANFAYIATLLGDRGLIASRVGADLFANRAVKELQEKGLVTSYLQLDSTHPTGTVDVQLDDKGKPTFVVKEDVAWDFLEWAAGWQELAEQADAVCFGTLAQRSQPSRETIRRFLTATRKDAVIFFDVNLRAPFYSAEVVSESLRLADIVKLNDEELPAVMELTGLRGDSEEESARRLLQAFDLRMVCVTRGERGSLLLIGEQTLEHPGVKVGVADTVGAGDAFSAALLYHYLRGARLEQISEAANRMGSWVASQVGAMPPAAPHILQGWSTKVRRT